MALSWGPVRLICGRADVYSFVTMEKRLCQGKQVTSEKDELGQVHETHLGNLQLHAPTEVMAYSQRNRSLCRKGTESYFETSDM